MESPIVVALIAGGVSLSGILLTQYLVRRQAAKDLRTLIDREIGIVKKLRPGSDEAVLLEKHIAKSIRLLISKEESRERVMQTVRPTAWNVLATVVLVSLLSLNEYRDRVGDQPPADVKSTTIAWDWLLDRAIWLAAVFYFLSLIVLLVENYRVWKPTVVFVGKLSALGFRVFRALTGIARARWETWRLKRALRPLIEAVDALDLSEGNNVVSAEAWTKVLVQQQKAKKAMAKARKRLPDEWEDTATEPPIDTEVVESSSDTNQPDSNDETVDGAGQG